MNARRVGFGDAAGSAGDDDAADGPQLVGRGVDGQHVTLNTHFAHAPREQVTVLPARVQHRNPLHAEIISDYGLWTVDHGLSTISFSKTPASVPALLRKRGAPQWPPRPGAWHPPWNSC